MESNICTRFRHFIVLILNKIKIQVYKKVFKEVAEIYDGAEDFMKKRIDDIYS